MAMRVGNSHRWSRDRQPHERRATKYRYRGAAGIIIYLIKREGELVFAVDVIGLEGIPQKVDAFLLGMGLEGER